MIILNLEKPGTISHFLQRGVFRELYPIVKAESWLNLKNSDGETWYYQNKDN